MKLWFLNGLFVESEDKNEIITTLANQFYKHIMLQEAGCYNTADLIECILRASADVDQDFISYLVEDLRQTRRDCLDAEHRVKQLLDEIKKLKERLNHAE